MVYALLVSAHCWEYCVTPFSARSVGDGWIRNGVSRYYDVTECNSVWWNVFEQSVFFLPSFYIYFYPLVLSTPLPHSLSLTPYLARSLSLRYFECLFSMWLQTPSGRVMVPHIYLNGLTQGGPSISTLAMWRKAPKSHAGGVFRGAFGSTP